MIYHLFNYLENSGTLRINPLQYETVRGFAALILAFLLSALFGRKVIAALKALKAGQPIRESSAKDAISLSDMHGKKAGTPTMGGILIIGSIVVSTLLLCSLTNMFVWLLLVVLLGFGALGFVDDYQKITKKNADGISPWAKIAGQAALGLLVGLVLYYAGKFDTNLVTYTYRSGSVVHTPIFEYDHIMLPFFKHFYPSIGLLFVVYCAVYLVGTSNAVNLTDGLDGLCIGITAIVGFAYVLLAYIAGSESMSAYLMTPHVDGASEVVVFMGALVGACMGFLWYNAHPAYMFMGDTGSLALGGSIGTVALICKQEILLGIIGGIFVLEAMSVIIQVASYKLRGKRVFLMSPIHHHFEKKNWHESKIIIRFWILTVLFVIIGLSTLKLR